MNQAAAQIEVAQASLVQRTQKYQDAATLRLIEGISSGGSQVELATPPASNVPPVHPVNAAPREGSSIHVIA
ncbi:MAG: hypothetical protein IPO09_12110 [Anaeromyxobacter sp.]|nr:hypothetical protein [Anaeromyxobacter sp.]MBL0276326.1 hypothetical protein [Anaeromyxobacter sp.]